MSYVDTLIDAVPKVRAHFIAEKQAEYFRTTRDSSRDGEVLVVVDFSENYSFVYQESVQGVHYNNNQATVHPFAAYNKVDGKLEPLNYAICEIICESLEHNTSTVHMCF